MPIEHINKTDTLNEGREKINEAIDGANAADVTSKAADTKATQALANSESTQTQLDTIVIDGDSSVEAAQARVDEKGDPHPTLKARIDDGFEKTNQQLAQTENKLIDTSVLVNGGNPQSVVVNRKLTPTLTIIDDDCRASLYNKLYPFIQQHNIPISAAVISDRIGATTPDHISLEQFRELKEDPRIEFLNHTKSHKYLSTLTDEEIDEEIRVCQEFLRSEGIYTSHLVYPYGDFDDRVRRIASKYVTSGSNSTGHIVNPYVSVLDSYYLRRVDFRDSYEDIIARIDEAHNLGAWIIIATHSHYSGEDFNIEKLADVVNYAKSLDFDIENFSNAYDRFKNVIEVRKDNIVHAGLSSGGYRAGLGDLTIDLGFKPSINDAPDKFPSQKESVYTISTSDATEKGWPGAGTVVTRRPSPSDSYTNQLFLPVRSNDVYRRNWNTSTNSWSNLTKDIAEVDINYKLDLVFKPTINTPPSEFYSGRETVNTLNASDADNGGWPTSGVLKTMRPIGSDSYTYQILHAHRSFDVYKRYWNSSTNKWSELKMISFV